MALRHTTFNTFIPGQQYSNMYMYVVEDKRSQYKEIQRNNCFLLLFCVEVFFAHLVATLLRTLEENMTAGC
jgi:hypothetical protein